MSQPPEPAGLSISEFARREGVDRTQVRRALAKGQISANPDGTIPSSAVGSQWRKPNRRTVVKKAGAAAVVPDVVPVAPPPKRKGETVAEAAERLVAELPLLTLDEALKLKENYLGRIKQLEYDIKAGAVHNSAACVTAVGKEYARVRTKILAIPSEQAPALFRCRTVAEIEDLLRGALIEALEALTLDEPAAGH